jgi:hypothetical protein
MEKDPVVSGGETSGLISSEEDIIELNHMDDGKTVPVEEVFKIESRKEKPSKSRSTKTIRFYPSEAEVAKVIEIFQERMVYTFNRKKAKYQGIMSQLGVNAQAHCDDTEDDCEDATEIIVSDQYPKGRIIRNSFRFGEDYSFRRLLRGIYNSFLRKKAMRITQPLDSIPKEEYDSVLKAVSSELSIAYEYQLAMLADEAQVNMVADHAVRCMMKYLKTAESVFSPTNLLQAVIEDTPRCSIRYYDRELKTKIVKTDNFGMRVDQKWRLYDILKQPGIRIINIQTGSYQYFGCFTPFGFCCRPNKYGFRGPLHVWNEAERKYTLVPNDMTSCVSSKRREITFNPKNVHHSYNPTLSCCHENVDCN